MPMHDWTRVDPYDYHTFHLYWIVSLASALNQGRLPNSYYAMADQVTSPVPRRRVAVKHIRDRQTVSVIEIVSPGDKAKRREFALLVGDLVRLLHLGIHLVIIDPFPANDVHSRVWEEFTAKKAGSIREKAASLNSYQAGGKKPTAYVDELAVGSVLPEMPLFLLDDAYVSLPLEESYRTAWDGYPAPLRKLLETAG
jgi:hypothetical protein